jgi:hypothetical protein
LSITIPAPESIQAALKNNFGSQDKKFVSRSLSRLKNSHVNWRNPERKK